MAYDQGLAARIRDELADRDGVTEKQMFGGIAYLLEGKMFVGIVGDELMVRVGPDADDEALERPHVRPMDFTGRPMKGYVFVAPKGVTEDSVLRDWIERALRHVATLPAKKKKKTIKRR
jgi:TfoX/Sxy family transcriptional regulator of competence genes